MLYKKIKKEYVIATMENLIVGDIVKFSQNDSPHAGGRTYFVLNKDNSKSIHLKNMNSLMLVKYNLDEHKFLF